MGFATDNVDELLKQPGLDAVCITTPSALHLEPALAAIRAGKHLMIEKPLDSTVEGTDHILHEAQKAGVRVGSIFQARFGDAARQVKAAIDAGRFGRMVLASCYVKWNRTAEYYTGWKGKLSEDGGGVRSPTCAFDRLAKAGKKIVLTERTMGGDDLDFLYIEKDGPLVGCVGRLG